MDCLVTKLNASVNNNLMEHFGKIYIYTNGFVQMVFNGAGSYTIKHSDSSENTYQYSSGNTKAVNEQGATVIINNKYTLERLEGATANYYFCLNDFKSVPVQILKSANENVNGDINSLVDCSLTSLLLQNCYGVTGNIESIGKQTSLTSCELYSTNAKNMKIEGDIVSVAPCTGLTTLNLVNCNIKGVVEEFVKEQMQSGRTSGTLVFKENNRNVYFNAKSSGGLHEITITYSATGAVVTCEVNGETIDTGTYVLATDTWTYE